MVLCRGQLTKLVCVFIFDVLRREVMFSLTTLNDDHNTFETQIVYIFTSE